MKMDELQVVLQGKVILPEKLPGTVAVSRLGLRPWVWIMV